MIYRVNSMYVGKSEMRDLPDALNLEKINREVA